MNIKVTFQNAAQRTHYVKWCQYSKNHLCVLFKWTCLHIRRQLHRNIL